ncbi:MAG: hypothetical protein PGN37_10175 [Mycobacterium kyogaense]|uniref:hypothetical protein n=1 Tax=Mycobacterium kyogaense TaxID=2212479 RepID=UPI002FF63C5A
MGDVRWGDVFASWFSSLTYGKKFAASLGLVGITVVGPTLVVSKVIPSLVGSSNQVEVWCTPDGSWRVWVGDDDPRLEVMDLYPNLGGICTFAF